MANKAVYEFAIKKEVLNSGKTVYIPVCRIKSKFTIFSNPWERITKIYKEFVVMDLHFIPDLTVEECKEHIAGYQAALNNAILDTVAKVEFEELEDFKV